MAKQTKGFCKYCRKEYTRTGMIRHLAACKEKENVFALAKEEVKYYELVLYGKYNKDYWLIVQVKENATLEDLDQFIRDIWVECCGHLSAFEICGQRYESNPAEDFFWGEPAKSMNCKLKKVLERGMQMECEYDYGSTTELVIRVQDYYNAPDQKEEITILSRNNPPEYSCAMKSHFRKFGNQMSGSGNHLCEFTRAVFYLGHTPPAWTCHAQHQHL